MIFRVFLSALLCAQIYARDFLVLDAFKRPVDDTMSMCTPDMNQMSMALEVGVCIDAPMHHTAEDLKSFKITNCQHPTDSDFLTVSLLLYTEAGCIGEGVPVTSSKDLPAGCDENMMVPTRFSCQSNPQSLTELWPAISLHFNDNMCSESALSIALRPGCVKLGSAGIGMKCQNDGKIMNFEMFEDTRSCAANLAGNYLGVPTETCLPVGVHFQDDMQLHSLLSKLGDVTRSGRQLRHNNKKSGPTNGAEMMEFSYSGFYMAHCNGY